MKRAARQAILRAAPPQMPAGALAIWDVSKGFQASPRPVIKNSTGNGATDYNLLSFSRNMYKSGGDTIWGQSNLTVTDAATAAPDGSTEASSCVNAASVNWQIEAATPDALPIGTYTLAVSLKSLSGSSLSCSLRATNSVQLTSPITITTAWQRFTFTFTKSAANASALAVFDGGSASVPNFAICDLELFAGSSDMNPNPMGARPPIIQAMDAPIGIDAFSANANLSGKLLNNLAIGYPILPAIQTMSVWTFAFGFVPTSAPSNSIELLLSKLASGNNGAWANFGVGPAVDNGASSGYASLYYSGNKLAQISRSGGGQIVSGNSWGAIGLGFTTFVVRYDGTKLSTFVNNIKVQECTISLGTAVTLQNMMLGAQNRSNSSGMKLGLASIYMRALTNDEVSQVFKYLVLKFGPVGTRRLIGLTGTSISAIIPTHYSYMGWNSLSPNRILSSQALASETTSVATANATPFLDALICNGPRQDEYVLLSELGTNDLASEVAASGSGSATITALANFLDARRNAGWQKVVQTTIMSRNDVAISPATEAAFNAARATVNTAIRGWVGTRINAVADWAGDATMGVDGACDSLTNFAADKVHPNAAGQQLLAPITAAALNGI